jgi:hypothetical protein
LVIGASEPSHDKMPLGDVEDPSDSDRALDGTNKACVVRPKPVVAVITFLPPLSKKPTAPHTRAPGAAQLTGT